MEESSTPATEKSDTSTTNSTDASGVPVTFTQQLPGKLLRVSEGEAVDLHVTLTGTPPFTVIWVRNDLPLSDCPRFRHLELGGGRYALRLPSPLAADSGVYFCEAYNRYGDTETWCRLNVAADPAKTISAAPEPVKTTSKPAVVTTKATTAELAVLDDSVFTNSKEDLTAGDESFSAGSENDDEDHPFQAAAQIVKGPVSVSTLVGSTVLLEALVIGRPEPTVRWLKGVSPKEREL